MGKILYVEDNEDDVFMLSWWLTRQGFQVLISGDGREGIALARSERPDLILMDLSLPGLDGWQATRSLKAATETRGIPIIVLTAHAMDGDREKALGCGADDYHTKPLRLAPLLAKIRALLG